MIGQLYRTFIYYTAAAACSFLSCGPQIDNSENEKIISVASEQKVKADTATTLAISKGLAAGSSVEFPKGSLPPDSTVKIDRADAPQEFSTSSAIEPVSAAVEISALDPSQTKLHEISTPLTIALPYTGVESGTNASLGIQSTTDSLCVLLKSDTQFFVWRQNDLKVDTARKKVHFKSVRIGIFQVVTCGDETLVGFEEASTSGADVGAFDLMLSSQLSTYLHGADILCFLIVKNNQGDSETKTEIIFSKELSGQDHIVVSESLLPTDTNSFIAISSHKKPNRCQESGALKLVAPHEPVAIHKFIVTPEDWSTFEGTHELGKGAYRTEKITLHLGVPKDSSIKPASALARDMCIIGSTQSGTETELTISTSTKGLFPNEKAAYSFYLPGKIEDSATISVTIGKTCKDAMPSSPNDLGEPYVVRFPKPTNDLYLVPVNMKATAPKGSVTLPACLLLYQGTAHETRKTKVEDLFPYRVGAYNIETGVEYRSYVPYDLDKDKKGVPLYDGVIHFVDHCMALESGVDESLPSQDISDKPLNPNFGVATE